MEKENLNRENHFFPNITGLRFIGALMVFVFHAFTLGREIWGNFTQDSWFKIASKMVIKGHLGVMLFFVLSGFLITYLMLLEKQKNGKIALSNFLARRFLRIWPLYFLIVFFGFVIFPHLPFGIQTVHEIWRFLLFLSNIDEIFVGARDSINFLTATWTISVEEQFYLSWALFIAFFGFKKSYIFRIFFALIIISSLLFRFYYLGNDRVIYYHTLSVISDFAIGGTLAVMTFKKKIQPLLKNLAKWKIVVIYLLGIAMIVLESKIFVGYLFVFERIAIGSFFAFVIAEQIYAGNSFFKIDDIPGLEKSGEFTYGFYMFHCIVIYYCQQIFLDNGWTNNPLFFLLFLILSFIITYIISALSYRYFESPFLKMKRFFR